MKNISKFLIAIAFCGVISVALLSFTSAKSAGVDAIAIGPVTIDEVSQSDVSLSNNDTFKTTHSSGFDNSESFALTKMSAGYDPFAGQVVETLTDRCSGDVVVKLPYADFPSLDGGDIILARSAAFCSLVQSSAFSGVCQSNPNVNSPFTTTISYSSIKNGDGRFRWFCRTTAERSRCKEGTNRVRFRIGPDRLFQTQCLN